MAEPQIFRAKSSQPVGTSSNCPQPFCVALYSKHRPFEACDNKFWEGEITERVAVVLRSWACGLWSLTLGVERRYRSIKDQRPKTQGLSPTSSSDAAFHQTKTA